MQDQKQIQTALHDRLESARDRCQAAAAAFHDAFSFVPSGVSLADHVKRIEIAKNHHAAAMSDFNLALRQWNEYVISGVVPERIAPIRERRARKRETIFAQFALSTR